MKKWKSIEEVMQQKAPGVPSNIKLDYRSKAVTPSSSSSVEKTIKIGSAETKPVTRNRPRPVPLADSTNKLKLKRPVDRTKSAGLQIDKLPAEPERPHRSKPATPTTPDPGGPKPTKENAKKTDSKSSNVILQIVKKSAKPPAPKLPDSILPPTLRPKSDKNLKITKNINNNDVWANSNDKVAQRRVPPSPVR
ncbi:hypothetical protein HF086_012141 [Spodoptera exigua]|uniref:Uncharacterized protein n=1 Tax=Spodoptera exigua TaxID=7107 RepID=A0A922SBS2_SPOEX|nr:hypothetical protein HF086_012141 [Spodoptera exigua]